MKPSISRRKFLGRVSLGAGAIGLTGCLGADEKNTGLKLPGSISIGTVSLMGLESQDSRARIEQITGIMKEILSEKPDIICLPEIFAQAYLPLNGETLFSLAKKAPEQVIAPMQKFAREHQCYIICPTYSVENENLFIAAFVIDRKGVITGEYRKMRPAANELEAGIIAGPADPPVFDTDFGKIGIQICYDVKFDEGWKSLKDKGAGIIFWPSAYAAGQEISSRAWRHQVYLVSSTQKDTSRICDLSGEAIAQTGRWQKNWTSAHINPEKAFIPTWPAVSLFPAIQLKYGSRVKLTTYSEEEWTIIESLDQDLKIIDLLAEYHLKNMHDTLKELSALQDRSRQKL